jgi:hypothetical protein
VAALALLCSAAILPGCGSKTPGGSDADLAGRWTLRMFDIDEQTGYLSADVVLIEIRKADGGGKEKAGLTAKVLDGTTRLRGAKVARFDVDGGAVRLVLEGSSGQVDFEGRRDGDAVRGNLTTGGFQLQPAWLDRTEKSRLASEDETRPAEGAAEFAQAVGAGETFAAIRSFAQSHPELPLTVQLYRRLTGEFRDQKLSKQAADEFAAAYFKASGRWGGRMVAYSQFDMGWELVTANQHLEQAKKYLEESRKGLPESVAAMIPWDKVFAQVEAKSLFAEATGKDSARAKAAAGKLVRLHERNPFDPLVLYAAAEAARQGGDKQSALRLFGRLAVWPMMERMVLNEALWLEGDRVLPSSQLLQLWVETRGTQDGLEGFKEQLFEECLTAFTAALVKPKLNPAGGRVSLIELFTGAQCPPCVAADIATVGVERGFPRDRVIVLRYHQHIPGPDPLANVQGAQRFDSYGGGGTPTVAVNGRVPEFGVGGFLSNADSAFAHLADALKEADGEGTKIRIDLQAELQSDDSVRASATLGGIDGSAGSDLRLHLVLAEDELHFAAANGIRRHDLVMRHMLGGVEGLPAKNGKFVPPEQPTLAAIRAALSQHLADVEEQSEQQFESKPMRLRPLWIVGFVQDARTKEVLQAAAIPVTGAGPTDTPDAPITASTTPETGPALPSLPAFPPAPSGDDEPTGNPPPKPATAQPAPAQSTSPQSSEPKPAVAERPEPTGPTLRPPGE